MKTRNLKTKAMSILLAIVMLLGMLPMSVFAADTPSYVALGDSISTGYGLEGYTVGTTPTNSFTYLLADDLGYELTNLAKDGNTAAGILAQLEDTEDTSVKTAVAGADLITITAGGNDLMAVLYQAIATEYNKLPVAEGDPITADEVLTIMSSSTDGRRLTVMSIAVGLLDSGSDIYMLNDQAFTDAITAYIATLNQVMSKIRALNETAPVIVATQYNPYVEFNGASITAFFPIDLTPIYSGMEAGVAALNTAIKNNAVTGKYIVADVKAAFDTAHSATNDLYVADPESLEIDFHPNAAGHAIIAETFAAAVPVVLDKPKTPVLSYNSFWLAHEATWTVDENASGYEYELYEDAGTEPVEKGSITVYDDYDGYGVDFEYAFKSGSTYKLRIKALGATGYADSVWSDYATYTYYHYDPIVVGNKLLHHGDKVEIDNDSYAVYEGEKGNAVLRLVNFELTADDIEDVEFLPEKGYENQSSYGGDKRAMIYTHLDQLTIVLEGTNALTCGVGNFALMEGGGKITISSTSNGKLTLTSDKINVRGIEAENSVTIQNCELNIATTATAISAYDIDFTKCEATLLTTSETGTVIPYYYSGSTNVTLTGCVAVAGADKDNTELFERVKYNYKYMKVSVPEVVLEAPTNLEMNNLTASWTAVANATGYEAELYVKYVGDDEFVRDAYSSNLITGTSYTFYSVLTAGEQYYFRVRALGNGETVGSSEWATSQVYERGDFFIGEVDLKDKQYLYNDGTISTAAPTDPNMGYAYYEKGETDTLTLSNFSFSGLSKDYGSLILGARSLDVKLIGDNSLTATEYLYSSGFFFETMPDFSSGQPSFPDITLKITGEANSTLTVDAEGMAAGYTPPYITVGAGVTVTSTGYVYADELTVNGALYAENGGITLYGKLIRGEQGYISAAVEEDAEYGAIEFSYGFDEPTSLTETDFLTLNGGEAVDGDGKATALGQYLYSYNYGPDYSYTEYIITFFDPSIPTADHTVENALKKVIICAKGAAAEALTGTVTISGDMQVGSTLTATVTDTNNTGELSYQWYRYVKNNTAIEGATDSTYTLTAENITYGIFCVVSSSVQTGTIQGYASGDVKPAPYTVEAVCDEYWGAVTGSGSYEEGATVTLTATPVDGTKFEYWLDTSVQLGDEPTEAELRAAIVSYEATYTFTAEKDVSLEAVFSLSGEIGIMPMLITGTDAESLFAAERWDVEHDFGSFTPGTEQIVLPGELVDNIVTIEDKQYQFKGFITFGYDEETDTETVELKETMTIAAMPLYDSAEYRDWFAPISDGVYAAYMEYTPEEDDGDEPQNPDNPDDSEDPNDPQNPDNYQNPTDPEKPDDSQTPSSPQTGDNSNMALWFALLFISGGAVITLTVCDKKRRNVTKR